MSTNQKVIQQVTKKIIVPGETPRTVNAGVDGRTKMVLAYLHPGEVPNEFMQSVLNFSRALPQVMILGLHSHVNVSSARNQLSEFIIKNSDTDYIMCVDSDMVFTPDDVAKLVEERRPIISGLYFGKDEKGRFPVASKVLNPKKSNQENLSKEDIADGKVIEVVWVGMGFCLITRKVFEDLGFGPLYPYSESVVDGDVVSEDVTFCLRAAEKGYKIFLHTGVKVGHVKREVLRP